MTAIKISSKNVLVTCSKYWHKCDGEYSEGIFDHGEKSDMQWVIMPRKFAWQIPFSSIYIPLPYFLFPLHTSHLHISFFHSSKQQLSLFYCDTEKSSNNIVPPMPRCGGCRRVLEDIYFDRDPRGVLRRTCRTCLVSYSNNFIALPNITIHHSNNIYNRRDKILEGVIEELEVFMHWLWRLGLKGTMIKVWHS